MIGMMFAFVINMTVSLQAPKVDCETIGPRSDGLYVTICDGHVTSFSDGQGNVQAYMTGKPQD